MATGFYLIDHPNRNVAQYGERRRGGEQPSGTIIIHTAENVADQIGEDLGAESVARYCSTRSDYGAYHRLVDADTIVKMVPFGYETWHCTKTNPWSIGISAAVRAGDWKKYGDAYETRVLRNLARAAADAVRSLKKDWGIIVPIKHISGADARAQKPGFTGHGQTDPDRRSDPGADFDWNRFLRMVQEELDGTTAPEEEPDMDKVQDARLTAIEKAVTTKVKDGDRLLEPHDAERVEIELLRRIERTNAARNLAERQRDADQRAQIAGLTAAVTELAKAQNLPVEATLEAIREAIAGITITVATEPKE